VGALALIATSCRNLDGFSTEGDAAYCGELVTASFVSTGLLPQDVAGPMEAELELDASALATLPGKLRTGDEQIGLCAPEPLFDDAPLRAIEPVLNDAISTLDFGEGREHSFFVWVDSTCQGPMMAVVSLMRNRRVELRLFKPALEGYDNAPPGERPGFGVFVFERRERGCDF